VNSLPGEGLERVGPLTDLRSSFVVDDDWIYVDGSPRRVS
jgi:hypothetical protein